MPEAFAGTPPRRKPRPRIPPPGAEAHSDDDRVFAALAGFRAALRRFLSFSETMAGAVNITTQQYQALLALRTRADREMMIKELAEELLLRPNGAVQLVDRLEHAGLVSRQASALDRRRVMVRLTAEGERLVAYLADTHARELLRREPLLAESLRRLRQVTRLAEAK